MRRKLFTAQLLAKEYTNNSFPFWGKGYGLSNAAIEVHDYVPII